MPGERFGSGVLGGGKHEKNSCIARHMQFCSLRRGVQMIQPFKHRLYALLHHLHPHDGAARAFQVGISSLIIVNAIAVMLETVNGLYARYGWAFTAFEQLSVACFRWNTWRVYGSQILTRPFNALSADVFVTPSHQWP